MQKIVFLYTKFYDGHGIYSRVTSLDGRNDFLSDDLELLIQNIIEKYAIFELTQWKYCLPAKYKKTFLIKINKGKLESIDY
jgi:hypothetical protein